MMSIVLVFAAYHTAVAYLTTHLSIEWSEVNKFKESILFCVTLR